MVCSFFLRNYSCLTMSAARSCRSCDNTSTRLDLITIPSPCAEQKKHAWLGWHATAGLCHLLVCNTPSPAVNLCYLDVASPHLKASAHPATNRMWRSLPAKLVLFKERAWLEALQRVCAFCSEQSIRNNRHGFKPALRSLAFTATGKWG